MKNLWIACIALMAFAQTALGQQKDYPERPIKLIAPTAPGATGDVAARFYAEKLAEILGQPVVVENRAGGNAIPAIMAVKQAPADGYTILLSSVSTNTVNPVTIKDLPYDPIKDFKPIRGLMAAYNALIVAGDSKFNTLEEFVAASKKTSGGLNFGSAFWSHRIAGEWLSSLAGAKFNYVQYKGVSQVLTDIIGHHIDATVLDLGPVAPLIKSGQLKVLATAGPTRHPELPQIPSISETYPEYVSIGWISLSVRSETPEHIVTKLADAVKKIQETEAARAFTKKMNGLPLPLNSAELAKFNADEIAKYRRVAAAAGIVPQ